jgi:hypothetical protein
MTNLKKAVLHLLCISVFLIGGCGRSASDTTLTQPWCSLYHGISCATGETLAPRQQKVYVIRADLKQPNIEFFSTPDNGDNPRMTDGQTTSEFLLMYGCKVAINANPFAPVDQTRPRDIHGLAISRGNLISGIDPRYPSLLITHDNHAIITDVNEGTNLMNVWTAVSGFSIVLRNGTNIGDGKSVHPRSAVGISKDGRYLYLVAIDGRQPGYSEGATLYETAEWLKQFGAYNGLNLDGGGSTTLVRSDNHNGVIVLNRPIHLNKPGNQRIVGNNLGIIVDTQ